MINGTYPLLRNFISFFLFFSFFFFFFFSFFFREGRERGRGGGGGSKKGGNRAFKIVKNFFGLSRAGPGGCRKEFVSIICNISERINKALKKKKKKKKKKPTNKLTQTQSNII